MLLIRVQRQIPGLDMERAQGLLLLLLLPPVTSRPSSLSRGPPDGLTGFTEQLLRQQPEKLVRSGTGPSVSGSPSP